MAAIAILQMTILYLYNTENKDQDFFGKISIAGFPYAIPDCKIIPAKFESVNI